MEEKTIIGYKGFNRNLTCRGFQYEKEKTFEYNGKVELRKSGFHFCVNPLDVLRYYLVNSYCELKRFFVVEASGEIKKDYSSDSLCCASRIRLIRELTLREMCERAVQGRPSEFVSCTKESVCTAYDNETTSIHRSGAVISTLGKWNSVFLAGDNSSVCNFGCNNKLFINSQSNEVYNEGSNCTIIITGNNNSLLNKGKNCNIVEIGDVNYIRNDGEGSAIYYTGLHTNFWGIPGKCHTDLYIDAQD